MPPARRLPRAFLVAGSALLAGCDADRITGLAFGGNDPTTPAVTPAGSGLACQTITFGEGGLTHGAPVTSIALEGFTVGFSVTPYVPGPDYGGRTPVGRLRAFDTGVQNHPEDGDLMVPPAGHCTQCIGQGNVLVIEHERGFASDGDYRWGGAITLSGIPAGHYVRSFKVLDNDACVDFPPEEATVRLLVGGELVGESSNQGSGTVEMVDATRILPIAGSVVFTLGTEARDQMGGSSALDDVVICRRD